MTEPATHWRQTLGAQLLAAGVGCLGVTLVDLGAQQCPDVGVRQDSPRHLGRAEAGHTAKH